MSSYLIVACPFEERQIESIICFLEMVSISGMFLFPRNQSESTNSDSAAMSSLLCTFDSLSFVFLLTRCCQWIICCYAYPSTCLYPLKICSSTDAYPSRLSLSADVYPLELSSSIDDYPSRFSSSTDVYSLKLSSSTNDYDISCAFLCINQLNNYNILTSFMSFLCLRIFII